METLVMGSMGNYLHMTELDDLMESMMAAYGYEVVWPVKIGESQEKRPIMAYAFMLDVKIENSVWELKNRSAILIDAVHHARELTTISQVVYTMMALLHGLEHGNAEYKALL